MDPDLTPGNPEWGADYEAGRAAYYAFRTDEAQRLLGSALEVARTDATRPWAPGLILYFLGETHYQDPEVEDLDAAVRALEESAAIWEQVFGANSTGLIPIKLRLGRVRALVGEEEAGAEDVRQAGVLLARLLESQGRPPPVRSEVPHIPNPEIYFAHAIAQDPAGERSCEPPPVLAGEVDPGDTYIRPISADDGVPRYVHVTESDMPWVVAVGRPRRPPRFGSTADAVRVTKEAMQAWEQAIQPKLPWFRLEFVDEDANAPVQVKWKRRIPGPWAGFGGISWAVKGGCLRVGGKMEIAVRSSDGIHTHLTVDGLRELVAHEFGHVLGLGHCHECESIMNYEHDRRTEITELDIRTFLRLVEIPNGSSISP